MSRKRLGAWTREVIAMQMQHGRYAPPKPLCPRTVCLYKPGVPQPGVHCAYHYTGSVPCTGQLRCFTCGGLKDE